jgi:hypothetical protein
VQKAGRKENLFVPLFKRRCFRYGVIIFTKQGNVILGPLEKQPIAESFPPGDHPIPATVKDPSITMSPLSGSHTAGH